MTKTERKVHEPLFHISKRDAVSWKRALLVRVITVLGAFLVSGILSWILIGVDPFTFIGKLFEGIFGTERRIWVMLRNLSILLCIALALAPAFKMRFWNIGAEGQVLMGGLATAICMYYLGDKLPEPVVWLCMIVAGIAAGALWAVIPAIFKAFWNTNETLFTLMMNYIAMQLVSFFTNVWVKDGSGTLKNETHLHGIMLPQLGNMYLLPIIVVALLTAGMFVYLKYSKHGYELSVVGESENTARYIGIDVKKVIIRTMAVSGAICGVAGLLLTGAINGTVTTATAGGQGFTAIIVSWLGKFNPLYMILTSFLVVFLDRGMVPLNLTNDAFSAIITGIVFFIIIGCEFFLSYQIKRRRDAKAEQTAMAEPVSGQSADGEEQTPQAEGADGVPTDTVRASVTAAEGVLTEESAAAVQTAQPSEEDGKSDGEQAQTPEEEDAALLRKIVDKTGEALKKGADAVADTAKKCAKKVREGAQRCKAFLSEKFRRKDKPQGGEGPADETAETKETEKTDGEDKAE